MERCLYSRTVTSSWTLRWWWGSSARLSPLGRMWMKSLVSRFGASCTTVGWRSCCWSGRTFCGLYRINGPPCWSPVRLWWSTQSCCWLHNSCTEWICRTMSCQQELMWVNLIFYQEKIIKWNFPFADEGNQFAPNWIYQGSLFARVEPPDEVNLHSHVLDHVATIGAGT